MSNLNLIKGDYMEIMRNMSSNSVDLICGTTGIVCKYLGINFIGVEIDEMYYNIALENTQ